ncbi:MAG: hypothetical protein LBV08_01745 [Clostridiales bacterium]|jgi:hypothetical protein|nr:hypothetical protein [Clostridiales bacterium]
MIGKAVKSIAIALVAGTIGGEVFDEFDDDIAKAAVCKLDDTAEGAGKMVDPNKLNHLFGKAEHNFDGLLKSFGGNQSQAYNVIQTAAQNYVTQNSITGVINASNQIIVNVAGYNVTVRGVVVDGVLKMGTSFIQP